jgi:hypothetical protein
VIIGGVNRAEMAIEMASTRAGRAVGWAAGITLAIVVGIRFRSPKGEGRAA